MDIDFCQNDKVFIARRNGVEVARSKNRDYLKRKIQAAIESLPPMPSAVEEFAINDRFTFTEQIVAMVADRTTASCLITGEGGLGKSFTVQKALRQSGLKDISEATVDSNVTSGYFRVIKGYSTPKGLYRSLFENKNGIIVFDDCDSILRDAEALNILKGALDSYDKRQITWNTSIDDPELPRSFEFKGGVIFISNMKAERIDQAVRSRAMCVDLSMTTDEKIERMETIMFSPSFMPDVDDEYKMDAIGAIKTFKDSAKEISLRTLIMVTRIRCSGNENWKQLAKYSLIA